MVYHTGRGVPTNGVESYRWTKKSAEAGNSEGMSNLGLSYLAGEGVEKNVAEAVKWFRKAVEVGNADGMSNLGYGC